MKKAWIQGIDFDPSGKKIASIDEAGVMLISDVDVSTKNSDFKSQKTGGWRNRCKWNPSETDSLVAFTSEIGKLTLINTETKKNLLQNTEIKFNNPKSSGCNCHFYLFLIFPLIRYILDRMVKQF